MAVTELNPELFIYELYNPNGAWELDDAFHVASAFGYCDASRLAVRPRTGEFALMVEWPNGAKGWFHVSPEMLQLIQRRLARMEASNGN